MAPVGLAQRLARIRTRLAAAKGAHMIVGAGCACGLPGGHIDASSIDTTIGAYLADKYAADGRDALADRLNPARASGGLSEILREMSDTAGSTEESDILSLCEDLETTLASLDDITRPKGASSFKVDDF